MPFGRHQPWAHGNKGNGKGYLFLVSIKDTKQKKCIIWPMTRLPNGHGILGYLGKMHGAHRLMCEMANGKKPTPKHECAHSCGKGHLGCVNPRHLCWKTRKQNQEDKVKHGNARNYPRRITAKIAVDIRKRYAEGQSQDAIAAHYGLGQPHISLIVNNKLWKKAA